MDVKTQPPAIPPAFSESPVEQLHPEYYPPPVPQDHTNFPDEKKHPPAFPEYQPETHNSQSHILPPPQHHSYHPPPPPVRLSQDLSILPPPRRKHISYDSNDDPSNPVSYIRDPHKLIAYLIPFPKPDLEGYEASEIPDRFLIYTPPAPPLSKPPEGVKEGKVHKVQRKWQEEVKEAKMSDAKTASWKGIKARVTKGINWAINRTTSADLDFVNRIPTEPDKKKAAKEKAKRDSHASDGVHEDDETHKTVGLEELVLVYPPSLGSDTEAVKREFVESMMRTRTKAKRDAVIATGLLPVTAAIDIMATLVWPFGGLLEIDSVWAFSSIRGAKTARSVTTRLTSSTKDGKLPESDPHSPASESHAESSTTAAHENPTEDTLRLRLTPSPRVETIRRYLAIKCHESDPKLFPYPGTGVSEHEVLESIGWSPAQTGGEKNWEDEAWQESQVKADLVNTMTKGGKAWDKWCKAFAKNPKKALKK
ncbi:hypothetical protein FRB95_002517 [Tulasnella sp. JGI-2019a]|nr:hypothetical protein FRB95_002517 [Tulasnella sp. JGI-2019a]